MIAGRGLLLPAVFTLIGLAVLVSLGFWQLERRIWKEAIISRAETRAHAAPIPLGPETDWRSATAERDEYRRVSVRGRFRHDLEARVYTVLSEPKGRSGGVGYWILTPLVLPSGAIVLINRGFVPEASKDPGTRAEGLVQGAVTVVGRIRMPEEASWFGPENDPARGMWYRRDPAAIAEAFKLERVAPFFIDAETAVPGGLPQTGETRLNFRNDHLGYAMTWFGLAAALAGVFAAFAWQRLKAAE